MAVAQNATWSPSEYATKKSILIVGDMDLSFCKFLMEYLPSSTHVTNTSLLSQYQLMGSNCRIDFILNKQFLLKTYQNLQIEHQIDVRNIKNNMHPLKFDCILFVYPQATNSAQLLSLKQFKRYHELNALLIEDYISNVSQIVSWNVDKSQIDFVIKENHIKNWIQKSMSEQFKNKWISNYEITVKKFDVSQYNKYTPRNEKGTRFNPGLSYI
eukprot:301437_1